MSEIRISAGWLLDADHVVAPLHRSSAGAITAITAWLLYADPQMARDIEALTELGVPVYSERGVDGGYRLLHGCTELLRFGAELEVIGPPELREAMAGLVTTIADRYRRPRRQSTGFGAGLQRAARGAGDQ